MSEQGRSLRPLYLPRPGNHQIGGGNFAELLGRKSFSSTRAESPAFWVIPGRSLRPQKNFTHLASVRWGQKICAQGRKFGAEVLAQSERADSLALRGGVSALPHSHPKWQGSDRGQKFSRSFGAEQKCSGPRAESPAQWGGISAPRNFLGN